MGILLLVVAAAAAAAIVVVIKEVYFYLDSLLFVKKFRENNKYMTMLDPFQEKYGSRITGLLFIPTAIGETFWAAAIFYALGTTISVVVGLDNITAVCVSAAVTILYSAFGGLYSVAYTDVVQLVFVFIGLVSVT